MPDIIKITKKDDVYLKVDTTPSIAQELKEYFTFDVPGAKFHPKYRARMWDGKISLYSMFTKEIYVGLKDYIEKFANDNGYEVDCSEYNSEADSISYEDTKTFCESLQLASRGKLLEVREYQIDAIHRAISNGRILLLSPTGSGKSLILYSLIRWNHVKNRKQLVIVPTTSLVEQLYSDFEDYSSINNWNVEQYCNKIYADYEKTNTFDITISTWQSLQRLPKKFFEVYDCIYGDESHIFRSKALTGILTKCVNSPYKIGATGTLDGTQTHKLVLEGLFGPVYKVTTTKTLMDSKQLADLKIFCIVLEYDESVRKIAKKLSYQQEMELLVTHPKRNRFIKNLALNCKGNTLVLFQYVEKHGKILYEMIQEAAHENRKIFFIHGGTETEDRESIRAIVENETDAIIVASFGTFSAGVNIRNLHNVIFASPTKSRIRNLQSIGRGLRVSDTKSTCNLYDIGDDLSWKKSKNYTLNHLIERVKIYSEESFDFKLVKVPLHE
jgi:superfamily II DNA or RNA helicase